MKMLGQIVGLILATLGGFAIVCNLVIFPAFDPSATVRISTLVVWGVVLAVGLLLRHLGSTKNDGTS
jgi:hypothetical protein